MKLDYCIGSLQLNKLCPTRWSSQIDAIRVVKNRHPDIIRLLTELWGDVTAQGLPKRMNTFEFTFSLILWEKILEKDQRVSNMLQTENLDLTAASRGLQNLLNTLDSGQARLEDRTGSF